MKKCFKCNAVKDRTEFYRHPQMADGLLGKCKECTKSDVANWYARTRNDRAAYERIRFQDQGRKESIRAYTNRYRKKHRDKFLARGKLHYALRRGAIVRPASCSVCGVACKPQAHHRDYSKPLDVQWMCFRCHREVGHGQTVTHGPCAAT